MEIKENFSDRAQRDLVIIKKALEGDTKSFAELMGYYNDALYFTILKIVNNKTDAEDLTIEAFGKAFKNLSSYSPNFAFSTWLFRIATNNCIDFLRKKKKSIKEISLDDHQGLEFPSEKIQVETEDLGPEEIMIMKQKSEYIRNVIAKLGVEYRKVVMLRFFDEMSYTEIAEELQIPIGTVKARLFRSRDLLLNIIKNIKK